jgi:hypothetical protein
MSSWLSEFRFCRCFIIHARRQRSQFHLVAEFLALQAIWQYPRWIHYSGSQCFVSFHPAFMRTLTPCIVVISVYYRSFVIRHSLHYRRVYFQHWWTLLSLANLTRNRPQVRARPKKISRNSLVLFTGFVSGRQSNAFSSTAKGPGIT